ncbi:MAG: efflux RND transporter permease subunit [Gemmatimonadaceae bacterium]|nr:efflux RND transporter permease subunit [Gemmatimonadaceae bacterium]
MSMLALAGFRTGRAVPTEDQRRFPVVQPPVVQTTILYPGAGPEQVEREVLEADRGNHSGPSQA